MTESFFQSDSGDKPVDVVPELEQPNFEDQAKTSSKIDGFETEEGRMAAILAYIPFLCFIPLLNMRENKEARFHARQGVMLFLVEFVAALFLIDGIANFVFKVLIVLAAALSVAGIIFAVQGKNYRLPIIGDIADKQKL
ncbi:MAG: hypothetical protein DRP47_02370 [Candidatus Zixiibacteriota bacterium]|nr:MAG: hypothetical protein DRP47_02370 [candidate division Zixibacteria bacterium]